MPLRNALLPTILFSITSFSIPKSRVKGHMFIASLCLGQSTLNLMLKPLIPHDSESSPSDVQGSRSLISYYRLPISDKISISVTQTSCKNTLC